MDTANKNNAIIALEKLAEDRQTTLSALAVNAGMSHTTLTRQRGKMTYAKLSAVFKKHGYESYEDFVVEQRMGDGMRKESEAILSAIATLLYILERENVIKKEGLLREAFSSVRAIHEKAPNAVGVKIMSDLIEAIDEIHEKKALPRTVIQSLANLTL